MTLTTKNKLLIFCIGLFVLNFILKFIFISSTDIGLDEPFTLFHAQKNVSDIIELPKTDIHPPLHILIIHFWVNLFGTGIVSARFLSVLFSALAAVAIFLTGKRFFSFKTGLIASLIFTASTIEMFYAHDARVYSIFIFLSISNLFLFLRIIDSGKDKGIKLQILFSIVNILLCYLHFFGFVILFAEALLCLLISQYRVHFKIIFLSISAVLLSFSWYIPIILDRFKATSHGNWIPEPLMSDLYTMIWRFSNVPIIAVTFIAILLFTTIFKWKQSNSETNSKFKTLLILFSICYFGLFIISWIIPVFVDRYLLFTSIYFYLLISYSLVNLTSNVKLNLIIAFVPVTIMFATLDLKKGKRTKTNAMTEFVSPMMEEPVSVIITPVWFDVNFTYYYNREWFKYTQHLNDTLKSHSIFLANHAENIPVLNSNFPVILIDNNTGNDSIKMFLNKTYNYKEEKEFGDGLKVMLFTTK